MTTGATSNPEDDIITGPQDGDSLAADLDNRREVTDAMLMGGHPNDNVGEEPEETPVAEAKPEVTEPEKPTEAKEEAAPQPRFNSQEDAEKAHAEAEKAMTQAKMEASDLRKLQESLEREREELRQKVASLEAAKPPEKPVEEVKPSKDMAELKAEAKAIRRKALEKISELDRTDDDYFDQWSGIMTDADAEVQALLTQAVTGKSLTREEALKLYQEQTEAERAKKAEADKQTATERAWQTVLEHGKKAGLALDDPDSADYLLYESLDRRVPQELYGNVQGVAEWMLTQAQSRLGKVALTAAEKAELARKAQTDNQPLGRGGGNNRPKPQPTQATEGSLADDFEEARRGRVIG